MISIRKLVHGTKAWYWIATGIVVAGVLVQWSEHVHSLRFNPSRWKSSTLEEGDRRVMQNDLIRLLKETPALDIDWVARNLGNPDYTYEVSEYSPWREMVYGLAILPPTSPGEACCIQVFYIDVDDTGKVRRWGVSATSVHDWGESVINQRQQSGNRSSE